MTCAASASRFAASDRRASTAPIARVVLFDRGWTHETKIVPGDVPSWVSGLGAGRWRCVACQRAPMPAPRAPDRLPDVTHAPRGLLVFMANGDGSVAWKKGGGETKFEAFAGETGTGYEWRMTALPAGATWSAIVARKSLPYDYEPLAVNVGFPDLDSAAAWCRLEVEATTRASFASAKSAKSCAAGRDARRYAAAMTDARKDELSSWSKELLIDHLATLLANEPSKRRRS